MKIDKKDVLTIIELFFALVDGFYKFKVDNIINDGVTHLDDKDRERLILIVNKYFDQFYNDPFFEEPIEVE